MNKIFVSIACFMDKDLLNTINDCLEKADNPNDIVFGICLQHDPNDDILKDYDNNPQFRIHKMHWKEAKGPMYARYYCYKLLEDEEYFLQIDCHTRFFQHWDTLIINELKKCEDISPKAVISHYPLNINRMYEERSKHIGHIVTYREISVNSIKSHGSLYKLPDEPLPSFGIMAAMIFTRGNTLKQVPYDLKTYHGYHAEEQFFYSARLWTHGYQCFTPSVHVLAMEYGTNRDRIETAGKAHLASEGSKWNQLTWQKCKYYLKLDSLENVTCEEYKDDILENQNILGLGNEKHIIDYYKYTGLHPKLCDLFPFYNNYQKMRWHDNFTHHMEMHNSGCKIAIVTQNTPNLIESYYKNVRENHIMYCNKNNYTYYVFYENLAEEVEKGESPKICWSKTKACLNVIKNHEYIMWMDADAIFANQNIKIEDMINKYPNKHFYLSKDPKTHFINSGVMIWKNSNEGNEILNKWWNEPHISYGKGGDQKPLGDLLKSNNELKDIWHHYEERDMNCYPTNYHPYDYIIHFMGVKSKININERLILWNKFIKHENENPLIYISIAVIPTRFGGLTKLIENLASSSVRPNKIIFQVPKEYLLFNSEGHISKISEILSEHIASGLVYINILDTDYGPCNKYQGMIQYYENNNLIDENFVSIIIDDDLLYYDFIIYELLQEHYKNKRSIISGYHMSTIKTHICNDKYRTPLIKGADSTLLPKYFFINNINPTLKELLNNCIVTHRDAIFDDDNLISAFTYFKKINKISVNKNFRKYNHKKSYTHNRLIKDIGLSNPKNNLIQRNSIRKVLNNFVYLYDFEKYSNVNFKP